MKLFLVRSFDNQVKIERWRELVVVAKDEKEAKEITFPHPDFSSEGSIFYKITPGNTFESLSGIPYSGEDHGYWYPNNDKLDIVYLGETSLTEPGAVSGYYNH